MNFSEQHALWFLYKISSSAACSLSVWTLEIAQQPRHGSIFSFESGPVFYPLSWSPSHLDFYLQVTWSFSIFIPSDLRAKSLGEIPSDFGCWLGDILDRSNTIICNFVSVSIHICDIIWYVLQYMYERQSEFSSLMNYVFDATGSDSIVGYLLVHGLLWCCIQWRHNRVDAWRHNSVDADAWRRQQRIARKTIGCVPN